MHAGAMRIAGLPPAVPSISARSMRRILALGLLALLMACNEVARPQPADRAAERPAPPVERCMNLSHSLEAPNEGDWGYRVRRSDLRGLAASGFDTVRLPVKFSAHSDPAPPHAIRPGLLARIDEIIAWAQAENLAVIVDVHNYEAISEAPHAEIPRLKAIWRQLSDHFEGAPDDVIFELLNEPHSALNVSRMDRLNRELLEVVRPAHPDRWVIVGSSQWNAPEAWLDSDPPRDDRILHTIHYYAPFGFTHQGAPWLNDPPPAGRSWGSEADRAQLSRDFARVAGKLERTGGPMLVGEFGVYRQVPLGLRARWIEAVRREAEAHGMGWCHWGYAGSFRSYDPDTEMWIAPVYGALMAE